MLNDLIMEGLKDLGGPESTSFGSQRTSADQLEHYARESLLAHDKRFQRPKGVRAPGDVLFVDGIRTAHINIKSVDHSKDFHMPNLISVDNLWRIFKQGDDFCLLVLAHSAGTLISKTFVDIRSVDWDCLRLAALGTGQIQIKDSSKPLLSWQGDAKAWMRRMRKEVISFYEHEKQKLDKRILAWESRG